MKSMTAKLAGKPLPMPAPEVEEYQNKEAKFTFSIEGIRRWYSAREKEQKRFISKDASIPHSMQVEGLKKKMKEFEIEEVAETTAKKEIKSMRDLLERGKAFKIYEPSQMGVLANILMRRFTYSLIDMFPEFFKNTFIVSNGDELKDIDLEEMYNVHKKKKALVTIALTKVEDPSKYGVAKLDGNKILEFVEKPKKEGAPSSLINSGFYMIEAEVIKMIPNGNSMLEKDVFPKLAKQGKLFGYQFNGQWFDIGNMERYEDAIKGWRNIEY